MNYLIALIIGFALGWVFSAQKRKISFMSKPFDHAQGKQTEKKEKNKRAIYELFETNHPLTNGDVQAMLDIPESTATRYFDELEKEGKVRQVGKTGRYVNYERV